MVPFDGAAVNAGPPGPDCARVRIGSSLHDLFIFIPALNITENNVNFRCSARTNQP